MMFVNPKHVRKNKLAPGGGYQNSGVSGDPTKSTPALGKIFIQIKVDNAVAQIKSMLAGTFQAPEPAQRGAGGAAAGEGRQGGGRGGRGGQAGDAAGATAANPAPPAPRQPTMETAPAGISPSHAPDTVFIDELTWEETRDVMKAGKTTAIIPTGGTEKNGYHMVLGKHNYIVTHSANLMARRLKNALVAPTIQYVPEGNPDRAGPGIISLPSPAYDQLLDAAARSLKAHGFKDIIFIGDSGGNQAGMRAVADAAQQGVGGQRASGLRAHRLLRGRTRTLPRMDAKRRSATTTDHREPCRHQRHVPVAPRPPGRRPQGSGQALGRTADSGVSGDPMKATAEIGRMGIEFKVNAALAQLRTLKRQR